MFCLYRLKYEVITLEDMERSIDKEVVELQRDYVVLSAEWKFLTTPDRLRFLSKRYLKLENTQPYQLAKLDDYFNSHSNLLVVSKKRIK